MSKFPDEYGFYWHMNLNGRWEIVEVIPTSSAVMGAKTFNGRVFYEGEHGEFSDRIKSPGESMYL